MADSRRKVRAGFTLIELLVVVAIIAVLMALLLPAVQKVRESANKVRCGDHLSQMAQAVHMFHHDFKMLPTGGGGCCGDPSYRGGINYGVWPPVANGSPEDPLNQYSGWGFQILPYIEQGTVYNSRNVQDATRALIPIYFCPSRRAPVRTYWDRGTIDYAAASPDWEYWQWTNRLMKALVIRNYAPWGHWWTNKVELSQGDIPNGTSNTMLFGEKWLNTDNYKYGDWHDDAGYVDGWDPDIIRLNTLQPIPDTNQGSGYGWEGWMFGSAHPNTFNIVMGDRTVKQIKYSIDINIFNYMGSRKNRNPIDWSQVD